MCDPVSAAVAATAVTAGSQIYQGKVQARMAENSNALMKFQTSEQITEVKEQKRINAIQAREEEIERRRLLEQDLSALTAYNRGFSSSSKDNIKSTAQELFGADVATNRFNLTIANTQADRQIGVLTAQGNMPSYASSIRTASYINATATAFSGYSNYLSVKTPTPTKPTVTSSYTPGGVTNVSSSGPGKTTGFANSGYTFKG